MEKIMSLVIKPIIIDNFISEEYQESIRLDPSFLEAKKNLEQAQKILIIR
jgi:hypothetical protein